MFFGYSGLVLGFETVERYFCKNSNIGVARAIRIKMRRMLMSGKRMLQLGGASLLLSGLILGSTSVYAHHSFAMFDASKSVTLNGTVKSVEYANPHVWVYLTVMNSKGQPDTWGMEGGNLGGLYRMGWTKDAVKAGDKITMEVHPLKDGTMGGQIIRVTMPDGHVFGRGGPPQ
jgi:hypothetical protein